MGSVSEGAGLARIAWQAFLPGMGATVAAALAFAMATGTFVGVLAVGAGIEAAFSIRDDGPERYVIQRKGARSESGSRLLNREVHVGVENPRIDVLSPELLVLARNQRLSRDSAYAPLLIRGVTQTALGLRPSFRISQGRIFTAGRAEAIVGEAAARTFADMRVGDVISHYASAPAEWTIVGHFSTDGDAHESEAWVDLATSQSVYRGGANMVSVVWTTLKSGVSLETVQTALDADPRFPVTIVPEHDVLESRSGVSLGRFRHLATAVGTVFLVGSALVATVATQTVVARSERAIRTLRTVGFSSSAIGWCVSMHVLGPCVVGGVGGVSVVYALLDGLPTSTTDGFGLQTSFDFTVSLADAFGSVVGLALVAAFVAFGTASLGSRASTQ